jgi:cytochrome oxidase Cu insertion factor (SCO1/SenC/PrrC family)
MRISKLAWAICLVGIIVMPLILWWQTISHSQPEATQTVAGVRIGGAFTLTDHTGKAVTDRSWPNQYLLVYFGFTHCPDVCPLGLTILTEAMNSLSPRTQNRIQPLFITVDPARDTVDSLKNYVPLFYPRLIGLTGTEDQVKSAIKAYRVYAEKQGTGQDYMMNHSAFTYLMSPKGELVHVFAHNTPATEMAAIITKEIRP